MISDLHFRTYHLSKVQTLTVKKCLLRAGFFCTHFTFFSVQSAKYFLTHTCASHTSLLGERKCISSGRKYSGCPYPFYSLWGITEPARSKESTFKIHQILHSVVIWKIFRTFEGWKLKKIWLDGVNIKHIQIIRLLFEEFRINRNKIRLI